MAQVLPFLKKQLAKIEGKFHDEVLRGDLRQRVPFARRRINVQQLTCKIDLSNSFYYFFFSFVLLELKPFVLKGKVPGEKL